jgi:hypothetical protein
MRHFNLTGTRRLLLGAAAALLLPGGASAAVRGTIAGKVYDFETKKLLPQVTVAVRTIGDTEHTFEAMTDAAGSYVLRDAPAALYSFTLKSGALEVPVKERMDLRVRMPFILESCFDLDASKKQASVRAECRSGFVEQARVATIGPHRFLLPDLPQEEPAAGDASQAMPTGIEHNGIECLTHDHHPRVDAAIRPGDQVETSRVYFRSDKYPDFYYVEMTKEHPTIDDFMGVLPKPGPETERIIYYLESVDTRFETLQTPEFAPEVIAADECRRRGTPAWFEGEPEIVVGATVPGAAAIPPGFQAVGITGFVNSLGVLSTLGVGGTAGGVVGSTAGAVLVVGGGAAAAATGIVIATGGDEASPPR